MSQVTRSRSVNTRAQSDPSISAQRDALPGGTISAVLTLALKLALIIAPIFLCLVFINKNAVNVPYFDDWHLLGSVFTRLQAGQLSLTELLNIQTGEHKCFVPWSLALAILSATKYNVVAIMHCEWLFLLLQCLCLGLIAWPSITGRSASPLLLLAPIVWVTFGIRQWDNLLWAATLMNVMTPFFFALTVLLLERSHKLDLCLVTAIVSAGLATYSFGHGVAIWPLGLLQIGLQRLVAFGTRNHTACTDVAAATPTGSAGSLQTGGWWQKLIAWCAAAGVCLALYLPHLRLGYNTGAHLNFATIKQNTCGVAQYMLACLGSPLSGDSSTAITAGVLMLAIFAAGIISAIGKSNEIRQKAIAPTILFLAGLATVCGVTIGRFNGGIDAALVSRYCTFTNLAVTGLYLLLLSLGRQKSPYETLRAGLMLGLISIGVISTTQASWVQGQAVRAQRVLLANMVRYEDIQSDDTIAQLSGLENIDLVRKACIYLKAHKLGLFAGPAPVQPSQLAQATHAPGPYLLESINSLPVHTYPLQKHVVIDKAMTKSLDFRGWAIDFKARGAAKAVYLSIDSRLDIPSGMGMPRSELPLQFHRFSYLCSGFGGTCSSNLLPNGVHRVTLKVVSADGQCYFESSPLATLEVK